MSVTPRINAIVGHVPTHDIHGAFVEWALARLADPREATLFRRMVARAGIEHRWSVLPSDQSPVTGAGFYAQAMPGTAARMALYAKHAPDLGLRAIEKLGPLGAITHLVVASCTGFVAPGIDQIIARRLGLPSSVERTLIGFMGCYAAVTALKTARQIVRSEPEAHVLVVTVELSTLHLQPDVTLEPLLAMLQFGDGAAAAIVSAHGEGLTLDQPFALSLPESGELIRWTIGDTGFAMHLSGEVPARIADALADPPVRATFEGCDAGTSWAVHAGGRSILDAVAHGLGLETDALDASRAVLRDYGNMSSATLMFVLAALFPQRPRKGIAMAFGPGLAVEGLHYGWTG